MDLKEHFRLEKLFDIYSGMLTEHQREIVELYIFEDLSLFEIAEKTNVSRQAVSMTISGAKKKLEELDKTLHMLEKTLQTQQIVEELLALDLPDEAHSAAHKLDNIWK